MRWQLRTLTESGVLVRRREDSFPGALEYELGPVGRDLLAVSETLQVWLAAAPDGALPLGSPAAKNAIQALREGWATGMLRALAAGPLRLTDLNRLINPITYPSLERRLGAMRLVGLVEAMPGKGEGTPYAVTRWARQAIGPVIAAVRWERRHFGDEITPTSRRDVETAFLLAVPMLRLRSSLSGVCRLAVELRNDGRQPVAGVMVTLEEGRIAACSSRLEERADALASGGPRAWLTALSEGDLACLELEGEAKLAAAVVEGIHTALFDGPREQRHAQGRRSPRS
jgi:DNA-binding HxlR family transcriptional regulator